MAIGKKNKISLNPLDVNLILLGEPKIGKEQPNSSMVLGEHGWIEMGDIRVGDKVFGEDGKLHNVTGVFPQGVKDVYELCFFDGSIARCGLEHLWRVGVHRENADVEYKVLSLKEIMKDYRTWVMPDFPNGMYSLKFKYSVQRNEPIMFESNDELHMPSYQFGLLIHDKESIPNEYLYSNVENRNLLLNGIVASYQCEYRDGYIVVPTDSKSLAKDIRDLAKSLGHVAYIGYLTVSGEKRFGVTISPQRLISAHIKPDVDNTFKPFTNMINSIDYVGTEECTCIMLDNPSHLYITDDYIVTHNTTIMKQLGDIYGGEDSSLFFEFGHENGHKYIEGILYETVDTWENYIDFVEELVENRTTEYKDLKTIVHDTLDNMVLVCEDYVLKQWNKEMARKGEPKVSSINEAYGGFMRGQDEVVRLINENLFKLRSMGYSPQIIGHLKMKDQTDTTGNTFQKLTSDVSNRYFNAIKKNFDLVAVAYIDRELIKDLKSKKSKVKSETRKIKFRDNDYTVDAGGRVSEIVSEVEFGAENLGKAIEEGLKNTASVSGVDIKKRTEEDEARAEKEEKDIEENSKRLKEERMLAEIQTKITQYISENKNDIDKIKELLAKAKELGVTNPTEITNLKDAMEIAKLIKE